MVIADAGIIYTTSTHIQGRPHHYCTSLSCTTLIDHQWWLVWYWESEEYNTHGRVCTGSKMNFPLSNVNSEEFIVQTFVTTERMEAELLLHRKKLELKLKVELSSLTVTSALYCPRPAYSPNPPSNTSWEGLNLMHSKVGLEAVP